jgi:hypothetical protein
VKKEAAMGHKALPKDTRSYAEKLLDPRWQRKRLEIMQRDAWRCQHCADERSTLHVHHRDYHYGLEPWDYPDAWLVTLCATCHAHETFGRRTNEKTLLRIMRRLGVPSSCLALLGGALYAWQGWQLSVPEQAKLLMALVDLMQDQPRLVAMAHDWLLEQQAQAPDAREALIKRQEQLVAAFSLKG